MSETVNKTFTEAYNSLVEAASEITKQTTSIDESLKLFDAGMKDAEYCKKILDEAEQKIEIYKTNEE